MPARCPELDVYLRKIGAKCKYLSSRDSYWRQDGSRFCKVETSDGETVVVFNELTLAKDGHRLPEAEINSKGWLKLRLVNAKRMEAAKRLAAELYNR
ncbi:hypothetical protein EHM69_09710 [candidate division KSB1 bacterium]|nr:MAG: hypothetical protein EHM69_09710 [candidate division KSB1 bacterium]